MSNQVTLQADVRTQLGKGPTNRLRKEGRVPGIMYGFEVTPTSVAVDSLELYHALHGPAGTNVLIRLEIAGEKGETHLCVARDIDRHPVRGDVRHIDFLAVDQSQRISVEVPIHLVDIDEAAKDGGVLQTVLYTVPILVRPLDTPNSFELSVDGMMIGDVRRVEDIRGLLPEGAEFDIDPERTIVTVNPPTILEEPEVDTEGVPEDALVGDEEGAEDASEVPAEGEGPTNESATE
ncbi:MAG: 50S ribosomal protein L25 [Actinobacteria bacterium]|nr:50S ribosomal protein L25 [Actinomycetota bacterium]